MSCSLALKGGVPVRRTPFPEWPIWDEAEEQALLGVLRSGKWGRLNGKYAATFEQAFAHAHGARHGIAMVNGSISLRVALLAAGIREGDEVIVPPYTFLATATSVVDVNATPVFADIDPDTYCLDPETVEAAITSRTRAVIPVHLGGQAADMDALCVVARKHGLAVIEDAAHAHGAEYKGRPVGALGHMGSFSFQSSKNLTAGEGGMITSNDDSLAGLCRSIHNCGRTSKGPWYEHAILGFNYRMTEFQAALLLCQLDRLQQQTERRDRNGLFLNRALGVIPGIRPLVRDESITRHAYHLYVFRYDAETFGGIPRRVFLEALQAEGIPCSAGYPVPLYGQPLFARRAFGPFTGYRHNRPDLDYSRSACPVCEKACREEACWITQSVLLGEESDMQDIARAVTKIFESREALMG